MKSFFFLTTLFALMALSSAEVQKNLRFKFGETTKKRNAANGGAQRTRQLKSDSDDAKGELGKRKFCGDDRFTMICKWKANKDKGSRSRRQLAEGEEETKELDLGNGRRLTGVKIEGIVCTLEVKEPGKSCDDSEDGSCDDGKTKYTQDIPFPDERWTLCETEAKDTFEVQGNLFTFETDIVFEDVVTGDSTDDITGDLALEFVILEIDSKDELFYDDSGIGFSCA